MTPTKRYIQCKNQGEAETLLGKMTAGFVASDFRVYEDIEFWDNSGVYELNGATLQSLYELQVSLEMMIDGRNELAWGEDLVLQATELKRVFEDAVKQIKFKPLRARRHK